MVAAACLLGEYLTAECWFGPTLASLFNVVPKESRGQSVLSIAFMSHGILLMMFAMCPSH